MKNSAHTPALPRWSEKLALAAGSLSGLYLLPINAQAAVVSVTGSPVSVGLSGASSVGWDVDGAGGNDFTLTRNQFGSFIGLALGAGGGLNAVSVVGGTQMEPLANGFVVGATLASHAWMVAQNRMSVMGYWTSTVNMFASSPMQEGDNYIGFSFKNGGDLHYGYALLNLNSSSQVATITSWAYNDTPDASITIGAPVSSVPEPGTASLALLGLGAAGLRGWRSRKKARTATATA